MNNYFKLKEAVSYDAEAGTLRWATPRGFKKQGALCSSNRITIDGQLYQPGKLAWYLTYCKWPRRSFRFVDGDRTNIKLSNLTENVSDRVVAKQLLEYWVKMTRTEAGFKVEASYPAKKRVDLGTYASYDEAVQVQRMFLECLT